MTDYFPDSGSITILSSCFWGQLITLHGCNSLWHPLILPNPGEQYCYHQNHSVFEWSCFQKLLIHLSSLPNVLHALKKSSWYLNGIFQYKRASTLFGLIVPQFCRGYPILNLKPLKKQVILPAQSHNLLIVYQKLEIKPSSSEGYHIFMTKSFMFGKFMKALPQNWMQDISQNSGATLKFWAN